MTYIGLLLSRLEDPFEIFPLQTVSRTLAEVIESTEERLWSKRGWYSPPEYTVEQEHDIEVIELLIGSAFVLAQTAITQAVSLVLKIHTEIDGAVRIPANKLQIMEVAVPRHAATGLSKITLIDSLANYHKHHHEWSDGWSGPENCRRTIDIVVALGLRPNAYFNLADALKQFDIGESKLSVLSHLVMNWREELAGYIRRELGEVD